MDTANSAPEQKKHPPSKKTGARKTAVLCIIISAEDDAQRRLVFDVALAKCKSHAAVEMQTAGNTLQACFLSADDALAAAIAALNQIHIIKAQAGAGSAAVSTKTGIGFGECRLEGHTLAGAASAAAEALARGCPDGGLLVAPEIKANAKETIGLDFNPAQNAQLSGGNALSVDWQESAELYDIDYAQALKPGPHLPDSLIPSSKASPESLECFYCGCTAHSARACPSKLIERAGNKISDLMYLPMQKVQSLFKQHYREIVRPLTSGASEERYDMIFKQQAASEFVLAFFSYYDLTDQFQHRMLRQIFSQVDKKEQQSGAVMMALDCLRVSRLDEARDWIEKAQVENPNDYRLPIVRCLHAIEQADVDRAFHWITKVRPLCGTEMQEGYAHLLCARLFEVTGDHREAATEADKALKLMQHAPRLLYYRAALYAIDNSFGPAMKIFKELINMSAVYYVMMLLDTRLQPIRDQLSAFLEGELAQLRSKGLKSFEHIKALLSEYSKWFAKKDETFSRANQLLQKAAGAINQGSIAGLLNIPAIESDVKNMLQSALIKRRDILIKEVGKHKNLHAQFIRYLTKYPYARAIGKDDRELAAHFIKCVEEGHSMSRTTRPEGLQNAREYLNQLETEAGKIHTRRARLEVQKHFWFTCEVSIKLILCFAISSLVTAVIFVLLLMGFQALTGAPTAGRLSRYILYGQSFGILSGFIVTGIWLKRNYIRLRAKLQG